MVLWHPEESVLLKDPDLLKEVLDRYGRLLRCDDYAFWEWGIADNTYCCGGLFWEKLGYQDVNKSVTTVDNIQEYIHPDDFGYVQNIILNNLRKNEPITMVYRLKAADGTYRWTQAAASSTRDESGRVTKITGINFDLSHLKDTEKALRLSEARHERVLSAANDGIWEWSATDANENPRKAGRSGVFHTSYSCWTHLGYTEEEVDSLPQNERLSIWKSHIHPHDLDYFVDELKKYIKTREPFDIEYRMFGENGNLFWVRSRGRGVFNTFDRMILFSGINIDITREKQAEENVRRAKEEAELANRIKSRFISSMSHELRTPLNSILGFSQLLSSDKKMTKEQRENAEHIHNAGQYLLRLINDVLDLGQVEAGKLALDPSSVRPQEVINDCFQFLKSDANKKMVRLRFEAHGLSDKKVYVDSLRLRQCILNLLTNSIKYNNKNGSVFVQLMEVDDQLEISVRDTGPGIPDEKLPDLFEAFNRLGAENSKVEGSGVGLVITKQIVELMGGTLNYCQELEQGACFKMSFPIMYEEQGELIHANSQKKELSNSTLPNLLLPSQQTKKIIYIEDNPLNTKLLEHWLKPYEQLELKVAHDPFLGLYHVRNELPDLVLMDIHLPDIDGIALLHIIRQSKATTDIPVIALSAGAMASDIESALNEGFDEYLTKPLDLAKLINLFNRLFKIDERRKSLASC